LTARVKDAREESKHLFNKPLQLPVCSLVLQGWRCPGERRPVGLLDSTVIVVMDVMDKNAFTGSAPDIRVNECQWIGFTTDRTSVQKRPSMNCTANQM
jgi:hypothetical protein